MGSFTLLIACLNIIITKALPVNKKWRFSAGRLEVPLGVYGLEMPSNV